MDKPPLVENQYELLKSYSGKIINPSDNQEEVNPTNSPLISLDSEDGSLTMMVGDERIVIPTDRPVSSYKIEDGVNNGDPSYDLYVSYRPF